MPRRFREAERVIEDRQLSAGNYEDQGVFGRKRPRIARSQSMDSAVSTKAAALIVRVVRLGDASQFAQILTQPCVPGSRRHSLTPGNSRHIE